MFKTDKYKITFKRIKPAFNIVCQIFDLTGKEYEVILATAASVLHPQDKYDKIKGKKIALTKAMIDHYEFKEVNGKTVKVPIWRFDKVDRAIIWQAFWNWVDSWGKEKCPACKEGVLILSSCEVKCNYCEHSDVLNINE